MGSCDWGESWCLNIESVILQSTSTNLKGIIGPLSILDSIISRNVQEELPDNAKDTTVLRNLFKPILSEQEYSGNEYIWETFNAFIMEKMEITFSVERLDEFCKNRGLLELLFHDLVKLKNGKEVIMGVDNDQNLIKPELLKVFKNVQRISAFCDEYPLSLESLLMLISGSEIKRVSLWGKEWLPKVKASTSYINHVEDVYKSYGWMMQFKDDDTYVKIWHSSVEW